MPEIKNNFIQAKMNKDLDERLVPNGQYRDAVNIQVSNSDGADVGAIENIRGNNLQVSGTGSSVDLGSTCVGSISDEAKNTIYWFVASPMSGHIQYNLEGDPNSGILDWSCKSCIASATDNFWWKDKIFEYNSITRGVKPVFVDNYLLKTKFEHTVNNASGINVNDTPSQVFKTTNNKHYYTLTHIRGYSSEEITVGMTAYFFNGSAHGSGIQDNLSGGTFPITRTVVAVDRGPHNNKTAVIFDKNLEQEHIDGFVNSSIQDHNYILFSKKRLLNFNCDNQITGINTLYDFLMWTDNDAEPKKIHIPRSINGTNPTGYKSTRLIVDERDISITDNILVKEENITVIKKYPKNKPLIEEKIEYPLTATTAFNFVSREDPNLPGTYLISENGDNITVTFSNFLGGNNFIVGEEIRFLEQTNTGQLPIDFKVRCKVLENLSNTTIVIPQPFPMSQITFTFPPNTYKLEILSISNNTTFDSTQGAYTTTAQMLAGIQWNVQRVLDDKKLFEKNMPRFGYRWKYQDGEYSAFSPFSDIVFEPGKFNYDSKKAYNKAMQNNLLRVTLRNIVANDMPDDVVQIDLLYIDTNSAVVYVVDKLRYNDYAHVSIGSLMYNHWRADQYEIKSDIIYAAVPENQILRPYDNVPRKALAQEITGNRLVYGNYLQNYTLRNNYEGLYEKPVLEASLENRWSPLVFTNTDRNGNITFVTNRVFYNDTYFDEQAMSYSQLDFPFPEAKPLGNLSGNASLKSLRQYQLGFTYLDEYGRETPVFSNSEATVDVTKSFADDYTLLSSKIVSNTPSWATDFRIYVKETANEYYNVVLDRVYKAEDGNLWLSFPSSERNKIQEDTFLILKKPADSDTLVEDEARYKVVSIENEAPDYLKRKIKLLIQAAGDPNISSGAPIDHLFTTGSSNTPLDTLLTPGSRTFKIESTRLEDETALNLFEARATSFDFNVGSQYSRKYNIVNITLDTASNEYTIILDKDVHSSEDWMYSNVTAATYDSDLKLSFYRETEDIKPEFFGKFFVKIEGDGIADQFLNTNLSANTFYGVISSFNFYYFSDTGKNGIIAGTTELQVDSTWNNYQSSAGFNPHTGATASVIHNAGDATTSGDLSTDGQDDWIAVFDLNLIAGRATSSWFIDEAFYAGVHPAGNHPNPNNPNHVNATDSNFNYGRGIFNESGQDYIELSFGQIEPSSGVAGNAFGGTNGDEINYANFNEAFIWAVGSSQNPVHADQNSVTKNFTPGTQFRILNDTNQVIYTISDNVSIQKIRRYNHTQWGEVKFRFDQWDADQSNTTKEQNYIDAWNRFAAPDNRRLTYVIPIDKDINGPSGSLISGNTVTDPNKNNSATQVAVANTIQFIEQRTDEDEDVISSSNPVIFETEPREAIDLNIFYQASDSYPTKLTIDTAEQYIPLGSVVVCKSHPFVTDNTEITFVTGWELNNFGELMVKFNQPLDVLGLGRLDVPDQQNLVLQFVRPDNSFTSIRGDWVNPITVPGFASSPSFKIGNQIQYVTVNMPWKETAYQVNTANVASNKIGISWFNAFSYGNGVESDRLRDIFNEKKLSKGFRVSTTIDEPYEEERRSSGLIYSGIYNSNSGVNDLNQFIQAEKITKDLNPTYGSIQKLFSRQTDLISFCEDRVIRIAANKDAIFNADGNPQLIATNNVLGQTLPFSGDYGISNNPESFASESYRAYFTDAKNGTVLRLSKDGLTPISDYGMKKHFIELLAISDGIKIIGSYDDKKDLYNLSINEHNCSSNTITYGNSRSTVSYSEKNRGWESFKSFEPESGVSLSGEYYTFKHGYIYRHHEDLVDRNTFYGQFTPSSVEFIFNEGPSIVKSFNTLNYEGSQAQVVEETAHPTVLSNASKGYYNLVGKTGWLCANIETDLQEGDVQEFINKEGKWFNYIKGKKL